MTSLQFPPRLGDVTAEIVRIHALKAAIDKAEQDSLDYVRFLGCMVTAQNAPLLASDIFAKRYPDFDEKRFELVQKAAVAIGTTTDATWAGPLAPVMPLVDDFLEYMRPLTILGKLPALRRVPFNVSVPTQTGGGVYTWVGQGAPTPVTSLAFATTTLAIAKSAGLVEIADELARVSTPAAALVVRTDLAAGIAAFMDVQFIAPNAAPIAGVSPGSVTYGVTPITPSGTTAAAVAKDVETLLAQVMTNNPDPSGVALVMRPQEAYMLARAAACQTLMQTGGTYFGTPVVVSAGVGTAIVALNQSAILFADGGLDVTTSKHGSRQPDSAPDNPPTAATVAVSYWPNNVVGFKAVRAINWKKATATAVSLVSPTAYVPGT